MGNRQGRLAAAATTTRCTTTTARFIAAVVLARRTAAITAATTTIRNGRALNDVARNRAGDEQQGRWRRHRSVAALAPPARMCT